jgi:hypothetical protein
VTHKRQQSAAYYAIIHVDLKFGASPTIQIWIVRWNSAGIPDEKNTLRISESIQGRGNPNGRPAGFFFSQKKNSPRVSVF